jgi:hypothetical protein
VSPYEQIAAQYEAHPQEHTFDFYVRWHLQHGFVFSTPDYFIMGRAVNREFVTNNGLTLDPQAAEHCDTWYIHAMAGNMTRAWDILPCSLPWLAWERVLDGKRDLRFYSAAEVKRLSCP